ncbi:EthD domain-containing protein [Rhodococcus koreensis]
MVTLMLALVRKADMSATEFRDYYEESHVPLTAKYVGHLYAEYRRNYLSEFPTIADNRPHATRGAPMSIDRDVPDVLTEIVFKNEADYAEFARILSDPEIQRIFAADEQNFLDPTLSRSGLARPAQGFPG